MSASMLLDTFRNTVVDRHAAELNEGLRPSIQWTLGATTSRPFKKRPPAQVKPEPGEFVAEKLSTSMGVRSTA